MAKAHYLKDSEGKFYPIAHTQATYNSDGTLLENRLTTDETAISGKVDKETGKSLVADADITQITTNKNAITTLNADSSTTGSVDQKIASAVGGITQFDYEVVTALPETGVKGKIYLVSNSGSGQNIYDEYIWIVVSETGKFEKIGTTEMDLSNYVQKEEGKSLIADTEITRLASVTNYDDSAVTGRLDTIEGKESGWDAKYDKPTGGIPKTDLASAVQTSLGLADTALQSYTETDPIFVASAAHGISADDITSWNGKADKATTLSGYGITDGITLAANDTYEAFES